jgi:hypothetical protein
MDWNAREGANARILLPSTSQIIPASSCKMRQLSRRSCLARIISGLRSQLDELLSLLQSLHRVSPQRFHPREQCPIRAIPFPNPNERNGPVAQKPVVNEIFILADDDGRLGPGAFPNHRIVRGVKSKIKDVRGLMTSAGNPFRERGRELRIYEEVHVGCKIAWSDWRAA